MALIGNNANTLLNGLSAFWHRLFRDIGDVQATYEGTEVLLGQTYLDLLSTVLNTSVIETPLFRKEFYHLFTVREDQLVYHEQGVQLGPLPEKTFYNNLGPDRYVFKNDTYFDSIPQLQDTIFSPAAALEAGTDFGVAGGEIQFFVDPTNPALPGFAKRRVVVGIGGKFSSLSTLDWVAAGVKKGDTLYFSEGTDVGIGSTLAAQDTARSATIVHVTTQFISVSIDTPFPTFPAGAEPAGFSWRVMRLRDDGVYNPGLPRSPAGTAPFTDGQISRVSAGGKLTNIVTLEVNEISFWAVDAQADDLALYNTYGYFFTNPHLSTEAYRSLVRGLMQLYILGPALARLESALNLTAGLPTIREEGEILTGYASGVVTTGITGSLLAGDIFQVPLATFSVASLGGYIKITGSNFASNIGEFNIIQYISPTQVKLKPVAPFTLDTMLAWTYTDTNKQVVSTNRNIYEYPLDTPMRTDVKDPASIGVLTFKAFETLTTAIVVTDYIQDPEWWHHITIPQSLLPDAPGSRRVVTPQLYPNVLGPAGNGYIGDPGFYIGQDEDGHVAVTNYRHNAAFILMDRFMKIHMFAVIVDASISLTSILVTDLQKIMREVKPVHTALYFQPVTTFVDVINLTDDAFTVGLVRRQIDEILALKNDLLIGSPWVVGDSWKFANPVGGALTLNPGIGGIYAAIGGADPSIQPLDPTNIPPGGNPDLGWFDRALYVYMHP